MPSFEPQLEIASLEDIRQAFQEAKKKFGRRPWFRGQRDGQWKLLPKVYRIIAERGCSREFESSVVQKFKARAPIRNPECPNQDDHFGWLSLMRHYGLSTRLLDWSESILIAAYFAVAGKAEGNPPAIWALDPYQLNASQGRGEHPLSPGNYYVAELARAPFGIGIGRKYGYALAVVPPEKDLLMLVQHATFTIVGTSVPLEEMQHAERFLMEFSVAESFRVGLFEMLNDLHIHRPALFPDLDRLAEGIEAFEPVPANHKDFKN